MSRVAKKPIVIPAGVTISQSETSLQIKGPKGTYAYSVHPSVDIVFSESSESSSDKIISTIPKDDSIATNALAGTTRANIANVIKGVTAGFDRKLLLVGVGYRAQLQGRKISFALGRSHPVEYHLPEGINAEIPTQTEIVISGIDKQQVGQVSAEIRALRSPEPYKGKGVRYANETISLKETKKK